jgi:hypothetical protein
MLRLKEKLPFSFFSSLTLTDVSKIDASLKGMSDFIEVVTATDE